MSLSLRIPPKIKALIAAAAMATTLAVCLAVTTPGAAHAGTTVCGNNCANLFNLGIGRGYQLDSYQQGQTTGTPIILFAQNTLDPGQDFAVVDIGQVTDLYLAGLVTPQLAEYYGHQEAYEIEYAPEGVELGECAGISQAPAPNHQSVPVSLQPCGVSAMTVWVPGFVGGSLTNGAATALINGASLNFWQPAVLTYPAFSKPTDNPRPQLTVTSITTFWEGPVNPATANITDNQLWAGYPGVSSAS